MTPTRGNLQSGRTGDPSTSSGLSSIAEGLQIGRLFVISGPSGVGKGTVVRALLSLRPNLAYSVSCTTRPPRPGEVDGVDYRFLSSEAFDRLVEEGEFLEWAEVFGHRYGTLAGPVRGVLGAGGDVVLEIDIQGARAVRERIPDAILVFLVPPSEEELARRLWARRTEPQEELARRLEAARKEMAERTWFDREVVNDDVGRAAAEVASIIDAASATDGSPRSP